MTIHRDSMVRHSNQLHEILHVLNQAVHRASYPGFNNNLASLPCEVCHTTIDTELLPDMCCDHCGKAPTWHHAHCCPSYVVAGAPPAPWRLPPPEIPTAWVDAPTATGDRGDVIPGERPDGESVTPEPIAHILANLLPNTQAICALCSSQFNGLASLYDHVNGRRHAAAMRAFCREHRRDPIRPLAIRGDDDDVDTWIRTDTATIPAAAVTVVIQDEEQIPKILRFDPRTTLIGNTPDDLLTHGQTVFHDGRVRNTAYVGKPGVCSPDRPMVKDDSSLRSQIARVKAAMLTKANCDSLQQPVFDSVLNGHQVMIIMYNEELEPKALFMDWTTPNDQLPSE